MDDWLILGLLALPFATWRISSILVNEEGPFNIMDGLRYAIGVRYNQSSQPYGTNVFADLFTCVWCMSVWVAAILTVISTFLPKVGAIINITFAASFVAILIDALLEKLDG